MCDVSCVHLFFLQLRVYYELKMWLAQLVEHSTFIAEVMSSNSV